MLFKDVIGQAEIKQQLVDMVSQNRLSHALLFLGSEGSGALTLGHCLRQLLSVLFLIHRQAKKMPILRYLATNSARKEIAVPTRLQEADAWMQIQPAFLKGRGMVHPDIHFSYPVIPRKPGDKPVSTDYITEWREFIAQYPYGNAYDWLQFIGAENKQGNITAHECNDIIRKLYLKSFESSYKILLMWMPEYLGNEGNKLLKLIEEPPPDTIFIFVAENESLILPTILSRTQLIRIPSLEDDRH